MKTKRTMKWVIALTAAVLFLTGCGSNEPEDVSPKVAIVLNCEDTPSCEMQIASLSEEALHYELYVVVERQDQGIKENSRNSNATPTVHKNFERAFYNIYSNNGDLGPKEVKQLETNYIASIDKGQTLVKMIVRVDGIDTVAYALISRPSDIPSPVTYELSYADGFITARAKLTKGIYCQEIGVYFGDDLEKPTTTFIAGSNSFSEVIIPVPDSAWIVELDFVGHRGDSYIPEEYKETHKYRMYYLVSSQ